MKLGEAVYKSQQKPGTDKTDNTKEAKPNDKENVVDADFEDVKDVKEEDKEKSA
jgi:molecular chaperone DnaK